MPQKQGSLLDGCVNLKHICSLDVLSNEKNILATTLISYPERTLFDWIFHFPVEWFHYTPGRITVVGRKITYKFNEILN